MLTPSPRLGAVSMLAQCFPMSVHTKTGIRYVLVTLRLLLALTPVLANNFILRQTWCRLCICKLSQFIPRVISSSSPTTCNFCPTHLLQVLFRHVALRRHPIYRNFSSSISPTSCTWWLFKATSCATEHHSQKQALVWPWP